MKIEKRLGFGGIVALAAGVLSIGGGAMAQTPGAQGQPVQRQERPDTRSAPARAAENYDPVGVAVGSFRLFPELELDEVYNDNIYATSTTAAGKTGSFIQLIKPTLDLRSDWTNHMLNLFAKGTLGIFSASSTENYQDASIGADGRFDIQRDWNVYGGGSFNHLHEDRGTPNSVTSLFSPTQYNQLLGNVGYFQKFNRLSARLDGRVDNYNYFNNGLGPAQGVIQNSDRNRTEFREAARVGYEFLPGYEVWTRGSLNQRVYNNTDGLGFNRSSNGWDIIGGVAIDFGGLTSIEVFGGYVQQTYSDFRFSTISVPTFGLTGYWNPIRELYVKPFIRRTVEDSALTSAAAYISTAGGVDVTYDMRPNIRLDGHADYSTADYAPEVGVIGTRYDQYITLRAGLKYMPTQNFFVGPTYQYIHRTSNQVGSDYDQNVVMLRLGAHL